MKYAVIQTGGKQYKVSEGDILEVEQLDAEKDHNITFGEVLLVADAGNVKLGTPVVTGATVKAIVIEHVLGDKIRVAKYKAKSRYRRVTGHRQHLTRIKIESISEGKAASQAEK